MARQSSIQTTLNWDRSLSPTHAASSSQVEPHPSQLSLNIDIEEAVSTVGSNNPDYFLDDNHDDIGNDQEFPFDLSPDKRHAIWTVAKGKRWEIWWTAKLQGHEGRHQFESISWTNKRRSEIWSVFCQAADIKTMLPKALCKFCWRAYAHPELRKGGSSTSTLSRHISKCKPGTMQQRLTESGMISLHPGVETYTAEAWRKQLLVSIVSASLPFRFVENTEVRKLFYMLRPGLEVPHRTTIRSDLDAEYLAVQERMFDDLLPESRVSIVLDGWQSPFARSFIAITAYYITADWQWREVLIGFEHIKTDYTGKAMAEVVLQVLQRFSLESKLYCITTDSAATNGKMRKDLDGMLDQLETGPSFEWDHEATKIPCLAHVIQLVVKAMLGALDIEPTEGGEEEGEEQSEEFDDNNTVVAAIQKIRSLGNLASRSSRRTELLLVKQSEVERKRLLRLKKDINIRWNSTYDMILRAMRLRVPLKSWLEAEMEKDPSLERLALTNTDWKKLRYLIVLLRPFASFTSLVGTSKDTTINHTWNIYNWLFNHLEQLQTKLSRKDHSLNPWISEFDAAITTGIQSLTLYYSRTSGPIEQQYALAGILDPTQKLDIFKSVDWTQKLKKKYERMFIQYWEANYKSQPQIEAPVPDNKVILTKPQSLNSVFRLNRNTPGVRSATSKAETEADIFLGSPIIQDTADISVLAIWRRLEPLYPSIACMARDLLAVPVAGTGVERIFNLARDLHNYHRAQIDPETITKLMVVKHFYRDIWELGNDWRNTDHKYGAPDKDRGTEQNEREIAEAAIISDDEDEESEVELPPIQRQKRKRPLDFTDIDELSPNRTGTTTRARRYL